MRMMWLWRLEILNGIKWSLMGLSEACAEKGGWEVGSGVETTNKKTQQGFFLYKYTGNRGNSDWKKSCLS